jgi:hypothetical protein
MSFDRAIASRLARACHVAYAVGQAGGITASPSYSAVNFTDDPDPIPGGAGGIDAAVVGRNVDGVIVAFRGTLPLRFDGGLADFLQSLLDWLNDTRAVLVPGYGGLVHQGFGESLEGLWPKLAQKIQARVGAGSRIYVTGHSKGGALATLAAVRLADELGLLPMAVYTYAAPRAGNGAFADHYGRTISESWRFENRDDIIPHLPPGGVLRHVLRELDPRFAQVAAFEYASVGTLQFIDWQGTIEGDSPLLEGRRLFSLSKQLVSGRLDVIAGDHDLTGDYFAAVGA